MPNDNLIGNISPEVPSSYLTLSREWLSIGPAEKLEDRLSKLEYEFPIIQALDKVLELVCQVKGKNVNEYLNSNPESKIELFKDLEFKGLSTLFNKLFSNTFETSTNEDSGQRYNEYCIYAKGICYIMDYIKQQQETGKLNELTKTALLDQMNDSAEQCAGGWREFIEKLFTNMLKDFIQNELPKPMEDLLTQQNAQISRKLLNLTTAALFEAQGIVLSKIQGNFISHLMQIQEKYDRELGYNAIRVNEGNKVHYDSAFMRHISIMYGLNRGIFTSKDSWLGPKRENLLYAILENYFIKNIKNENISKLDLQHETYLQFRELIASKIKGDSEFREALTDGIRKLFEGTDMSLTLENSGILELEDENYRNKAILEFENEQTKNNYFMDKFVYDFIENEIYPDFVDKFLHRISILTPQTFDLKKDIFQSFCHIQMGLEKSSSEKYKQIIQILESPDVIIKDDRTIYIPQIKSTIGLDELNNLFGLCSMYGTPNNIQLLTKLRGMQFSEEQKLDLLKQSIKSNNVSMTEYLFKDLQIKHYFVFLPQICEMKSDASEFIKKIFEDAIYNNRDLFIQNIDLILPNLSKSLKGHKSHLKTIIDILMEAKLNRFGYSHNDAHIGHISNKIDSQILAVSKQAYENNFPEAFKFLLDNGARYNFKDFTKSIEDNRLELLDVLLKRPRLIFSHEQKEHLLHCAVKEGNKEALRKILSHIKFDNAKLYSATLQTFEKDQRDCYSILYNRLLSQKSPDNNESIPKALLKHLLENESLITESRLNAISKLLILGADIDSNNIGNILKEFDKDTHNGTIFQILEPDEVNSIKDSRNCSSLQISILEGYEKVFENLILLGADINKKFTNGDNPLSLAISKNRGNIINILLKQDNIDINSRNKQNISPVMQSIRKYNIFMERKDFEKAASFMNITKELLKKGAQLTNEDFHSKFDGENSDMALFFKNASSSDRLFLAEQFQQRDCLEFIDKSLMEETIIDFGAKYSEENLKNFEQMLSLNPAFLTKRDENGILILVNNIWEHFLSIYCDKLKQNLPPETSNKILDELLAQSLNMLNINESYYSEYRISTLISHGANPEITDHTYGLTALHQAAIRGSLPMIDWLVQNGANINCTIQSNKWTPLMIATTFENLDLVKKLQDLGADHKMVKDNGCKAIDIAGENLNLELIKTLNKIEKAGQITLFNVLLRMKKDKESEAGLNCVDFLIKEGVDINSKVHYIRRPIFFLDFAASWSLQSSTISLFLNGAPFEKPETEKLLINIMENQPLDTSYRVAQEWLNRNGTLPNSILEERLTDLFIKSVKENNWELAKSCKPVRFDIEKLSEKDYLQLLSYSFEKQDQQIIKDVLNKVLKKGTFCYDKNILKILGDNLSLLKNDTELLVIAMKFFIINDLKEKVVKCLEMGAINYIKDSKDSPEMLATKWGRAEILKEILEEQKMDCLQNTPEENNFKARCSEIIYKICSSNSNIYAERLIDVVSKFDFDCKSYFTYTDGKTSFEETPLLAACRLGNADIISQLVSIGYDIEAVVKPSVDSQVQDMVSESNSLAPEIGKTALQISAKRILSEGWDNSNNDITFIELLRCGANIKTVPTEDMNRIIFSVIKLFKKNHLLPFACSFIFNDLILLSEKGASLAFLKNLTGEEKVEFKEIMDKLRSTHDYIAKDLKTIIKADVKEDRSKHHSADNGILRGLKSLLPSIAPIKRNTSRQQEI